jgi:hypothetical protein
MGQDSELYTVGSNYLIVEDKAGLGGRMECSDSVDLTGTRGRTSACRWKEIRKGLI